MPKMCRCRTDQTKAGRFSGSVWIRGSASELLVPEAMARYSQPRVWWGASTSWVTLMSGVHSNTLSQGVSASKIPCKYTHLPSKYPYPLPITYPIYIPYRYPIHDTQLDSQTGERLEMFSSYEKSPGSQMGKWSTSIFHFCCDSIHPARSCETAMLYSSGNWHYRNSWTQPLKIQCFQGFPALSMAKANSKQIKSVKHWPGTAKWYKIESLKRLVRQSNSDAVL